MYKGMEVWERMYSNKKTLSKWNDRKRVCTFVCSILLIILLSGCGEQKQWYEEYPVVCHALGKTEEGYTLTNSLEAFEYNYELGQRIFEVDCAITSDQVVVLRHDWESDLGQAEGFGWTEEERDVPTAELFLSVPIYERYTPMTLLDIYQKMSEKPDMYLVLDPKYSADVEGQFSLIVNTALDNGLESVLDRVIVQLYYEDMYDEVEAVYSFQNYIYTLYYIGFPGGESVGNFCEEKGIPVLVMPYTWLSGNIMQELEPYQIRLYVHTVDELEDMYGVASFHVDGVYSDEILPEQVTEILDE